MTKWIVSALNAVIFIMVLSLAHAEDTRKHIIDPKNTSILGISVSSNENDIVRILGAPNHLQERYSEAFDTKFRYLSYDGIEIRFGDGDMWGLSCTAAKCETNLGAKIGDEKSRVIKLYGKGNKPYRGATRDSASYPFKSCDCYLVFYFENGSVVEISYFYDYA